MGAKKSVPVDKVSEYVDVRCDNDDTHTAILFCEKCDANLCQMCSDGLHSFKMLSNHKLSRFSGVPRPLVYCYSHPNKLAQYVCKDFSCIHHSKPTCTMCYQSGSHVGCIKNDLEDEYKEVKENIANCTKTLNEKIGTCREHCEKYDRFISTLLCIETRFIACARDKKKHTLLSKEVDDQIHALKLFKYEYEQEIVTLKVENGVLGNINEKEKKEIVTFGWVVKLAMRTAERKIEDPVGLVMPKSFDFLCPAIKPEVMHLRNAVYFANYSWFFSIIFEVSFIITMIEAIHFHSEYVFDLRKRDIRHVANRSNGKVCKVEDYDSSILCLREEPNDATVNASLYRYIAVIYSCSDVKKNRKKVKKLMQKKWWSKILVIKTKYDNKKEPSFASFDNWMIKEALKDKRLEIIKNNRKLIFKKLFEV